MPKKGKKTGLDQTLKHYLQIPCSGSLPYDTLLVMYVPHSMYNLIAYIQ